MPARPGVSVPTMAIEYVTSPPEAARRRFRAAASTGQPLWRLRQQQGAVGRNDNTDRPSAPNGSDHWSVVGAAQQQFAAVGAFVDDQQRLDRGEAQRVGRAEDRPLEQAEVVDDRVAQQQRLLFGVPDGFGLVFAAAGGKPLAYSSRPLSRSPSFQSQPIEARICALNVMLHSRGQVDRALEVDNHFPGAVVALLLVVVQPLHVEHRVAAGQIEGRAIEGTLDLVNDCRGGVVLLRETRESAGPPGRWPSRRSDTSRADRSAW